MSISNMKKKVSMAIVGAAFITLGTAAPSIADITYTGTTLNQPTWNRPDYNNSSTTLSGVVVPYSSYPFSVNTNGDYKLASKTDNFNYYSSLFLYENSFNSSQPNTNVLSGDTYVSGSSYYGNNDSVPLTAGTNYFLVTTGDTSNDYGSFTNTISPVPEPMSILGSLTAITFGVNLCRTFKQQKKAKAKV